MTKGSEIASVWGKQAGFFGQQRLRDLGARIDAAIAEAQAERKRERETEAQKVYDKAMLEYGDPPVLAARLKEYMVELERVRREYIDCDPLVICCDKCERSHHRTCPRIVIAEEREACARVANDMTTLGPPRSAGFTAQQARIQQNEHIAAAIRARKE